MWPGISGIITLVVMVLKLWIDNHNEIKKANDDEKKKIADDIASGDDARINATIDKLRQ